MNVERREFLKAAGAASSIGLTGTAAAQGTGATVAMKTQDGSYFFDPIGLHVQPGDTVTFENVSGSHASTAYVAGTGGARVTRIPDGAAGWNSGILTAPGATFEHTFEVEGTYDYFCVPHKTLGMVGRIVVGEPDGPAEGSMPPDGDVPQSGTIVDAGSVSYDEFASDAGAGGPTDDQGGGLGGGAVSQPLVGAGLLGGLAVLAGLVYRAVSSEGEQHRVGSAAWKRKYRGRRPGGDER